MVSCYFICICPVSYLEMYCLISNYREIFHVSCSLISTLISLWSKIYFGDYNSSKLLMLSLISVNAPTAFGRICISTPVEWSVYKCQWIQLTLFFKHFWLLFCPLFLLTNRRVGISSVSLVLTVFALCILNHQSYLK